MKTKRNEEKITIRMSKEKKKRCHGWCTTGMADPRGLAAGPTDEADEAGLKTGVERAEPAALAPPPPPPQTSLVVGLGGVYVSRVVRWPPPLSTCSPKRRSLFGERRPPVDEEGESLTCRGGSR